jgi:hypothetical protein
VLRGQHGGGGPWDAAADSFGLGQHAFHAAFGERPGAKNAGHSPPITSASVDMSPESEGKRALLRLFPRDIPLLFLPGVYCVTGHSIRTKRRAYEKKRGGYDPPRFSLL